MNSNTIKYEETMVWILTGTAFLLLLILVLPALTAHDMPTQRSLVLGIGGGPTETVPITRIDTIVSEPNKGSLVENKTRLENVLLQKKLTDTIFWVGPNSDTKVLIVYIHPNRSIANALVATSELYIDGTIKPLPSEETILYDWKLSKDMLQELKGKLIYIEAIRIIQ